MCLKNSAHTHTHHHHHHHPALFWLWFTSEHCTTNRPSRMGPSMKPTPRNAPNVAFAFANSNPRYLSANVADTPAMNAAVEVIERTPYLCWGRG